MTTDTDQQLLIFNTLTFGIVKQLAKAGSWRRGYEYYRTSQVGNIDLNEDGVIATVKGKFKSGYETRLIFQAEGIEPKCACPLDEKWCKHAVAVALEAVNQNLWEKYWHIPYDDSLDVASDDYQGKYRFFLELIIDKSKHPNRDPNRLAKHLAMRMMDRETGDYVEDAEACLKAIVMAGEKVSEATKKELAIMQELVKIRLLTPNKAGGWFQVRPQDRQQFLDLLSEVEDVCDSEGNRLIFEDQKLQLTMAVNASMAGNVLVSLHWVKPQNGKPQQKKKSTALAENDAAVNLADVPDAFPLEEIITLSKEVKWGFHHNRIYPLSHKLASLPGYLAKSTFTDIRDADGGKFMYEELPKLRRILPVDEADILDQLKLQQKPPTKVLNLELIDVANLRMRVSLSFNYDGVEVPWSKKTPDTPYVMVVKKSADTIYWVKRDLKAEHAVWHMLVDGGLEPIQTNFFQSEGDSTIDFFYHTIRSIDKAAFEKEWVINKSGDLDMIKVSEHPLKIQAEIDFSDSVDSFILCVSCKVGKQELDLDEVQSHLMQGKKYFFMDKAGFVEVPLAQMLQFGKTLQFFDAEEIRRDVYKIQTYKAGLIAELVDQGVEFKFSKKFEKFWQVISGQKDMDEVDVPESVQATLRPYQVKGFRWLWFLYSYGLNGILADDMGLGKTLQALVMLQKAKEEDLAKGKHPTPSLIICPTSVVFNWEAEIKRFTPELSVVNLTGAKRSGAFKKIRESDIAITSYALLRRDIRALKNYPFRCAILDESQYIKNHESQTAQASKQLQAAHRLALSGTPIENRLSELWSAFDFLMPGFLYDIDTFRYKFINPIEEKGNVDAERRLKKQVFPFLLRRMKQDVVKDLPPKIENVSYCELTDKQRELYLDVLEEMRDQIFQASSSGAVEANQNAVFTLLLRLRQICCHPALVGGDLNQGIEESGKFEALKDMLEDVIANGHRVLLFSQFVEMLKLIRAWLDKRGLKYEYLTGETKDREGAVNRFNNDDSIPIFLISLKAGGTGLNLTGADYVIHYDPWWNPAAEDQATSRAHRIGQTKSVFVYRMITKGTVEEKIVKLQSKKRDLVDTIIAADRSMGKFLSIDDLKDILTPDF